MKCMARFGFWFPLAFALAAFSVINGGATAGSIEPANIQHMAGGPGTILRREEIPGAPFNAKAWRILYESTAPDGRPIAVSGVVVIPAGAATEGARPIVAWAHPTTGVELQCAPSRAIFLFQQIQGLRDMVAYGYIVAASDYPGLRTTGPHPYLVGESEARAVIDSVRAARALAGPEASARFAVWGHSQGGHAALFTGMIAARYAPELSLVGVAVAAPATDLADLLRADIDSPAGKNITVMTLSSWSRVYGAPIDTVVLPAAIPVVNRLAGECIESVFDLIVRARTERPLEQNFPTVRDVTVIPPWKGLVVLNTPGTLPTNVPVFVAQGTVDAIVPPRITWDYARKLCAAGSRVTLRVLRDGGHAFAAMHSARDAVDWIAARFAGLAAPSDCS